MIVPEVLDYLLPNYGNKPAPQRRERKIYSMGVNVKVSKFQVTEINLRFVVQSMCCLLYTSTLRFSLNTAISVR